MKITEVTENDAKLISKLIMMVQAGEWTMNGKDFCQAADAVRWLQNTAVVMAENLKEARSSVAPVSAPVVTPEEPPKGGLPEGVVMKSFSPGKVKGK